MPNGKAQDTVYDSADDEELLQSEAGPANKKQKVAKKVTLSPEEIDEKLKKLFQQKTNAEFKKHNYETRRMAVEVQIMKIDGEVKKMKMMLDNISKESSD